MLERKRLKLDPSFADNFFKLDKVESEEETLSAALDFSLPISYVTFADFKASAEGKIFEERVCALIDKVYEIADKKTKVFDNNIHDFKKNHILTDGKDLGLNVNDFGLYETGIPLLVSVVNMLQDKTIAESLRIDTARNLLSDIGRCGPGDSIQIACAYRVLKASKSLPARWLKFRSDIAEQVLVSGITKIRHLIHMGNDIHYINAIMSHFADALGLRHNQDVLITVCGEPELGFLYDYFSIHFPKHLTIEKLFELIIDDLALQDWMNLLLQRQQEIAVTNDRAPFNDVKQVLEEKLSRYGVSTFSFTDVCIMDESGAKVVGLSCYAKTILYQDLLIRLINSNYLAEVAYMPLGALPANYIFVLPGKSLQFAYVLQGKLKQPFLSLFLELLIADDARWIEYHITICKSPRLKVELATSIVDYFNSTEYSLKPLSENEINRIILALVLLDTTQWFSHVCRLPHPVAKYYFNLFLGQYTGNDELVKEISSFFFKYKYKYHETLVNALLKLIPISQALDPYGRPMLHIVSILNYSEMVRALVNHGAPVDIANEKGATPLMCACNREALQAVKVLIELKANVNYVNARGKTALQFACKKLNLNVVEALISAKANVKQADLDGVTPLHWALDLSTPEIVSSLIIAGADVNAVSLAGVSVLSTAIHSLEWPKVKALLDAGARLALTRAETVQLLEILKAYDYPAESASILSILVDNYIEDLKTREVKNSGDKLNPHHFSADQIKLNAKVASSARLFALIEGEGRCDSPRESNGLPKVSWKTACENSKRMRFFVETYEKLVEKKVLPVRNSPKF